MVNQQLQAGDVFSARDAANELGVHFTTIYRWIQKKEIVYITFGGSIFIPFLEVERLKREKANKVGVGQSTDTVPSGLNDQRP